MATSAAEQRRPDTEAPTPAALARESGYIGLKISSKQILEEADRRLRFPNLVTTIDEMRKDGIVNAALQFYNMFICSRKWQAVHPVGASKKTKERTKYLNEVMQDMDWGAFIAQASSFIAYGFSAHEVVLKKRLKKNGSKYNDGLWGIKDLPIRAQATIGKWVFSADGRELVALEQDLSRLSAMGRYDAVIAAGNTEITIPIKVGDRYKVLLFRADPRNDNPEGNAPLKASYRSWRMKQVVQESELNSLSRDLGGVVVGTMPASYMAPDAPPEKKEVFKYYQNVVRNAHNNEQAGIIMPSDVDETTKTKLFSFELLQGNGGKAYDTTEVIKRLNTEILMSLFTDILQLGNTGAGSFALSHDKTTIVSTAITHRLNEMCNVLNKQLIPTLWIQNGWDLDELPTIEFSPLDKPDTDEFSKALQRAASVGLVEVRRENLNVINEVLGFPLVPQDTPIDPDKMTMASSRSGDGMATAGEGTSKQPSGRDTSSNNNENAA